jgi:hypothetical protein
VSRTSSGAKVAAGLALLSAAAAACGKSADVTSRVVTLHVPVACAADDSAYGEYYAFGDFEPALPASGHVLSDVGDVLSEIAPASRELVVMAGESAMAWEGATSVAAAGDVDLLLLPTLASCALSTPVDARVGAALAPMDSGRVLIVGGDGNPTPRTFVADLSTGAVAPVTTGLLTQRTGASVTAFADGALVAGGVGDDGKALATAEVYEPALSGFDQQQPIQLGDPRGYPGAVVLATGETLLVGGVGEDLTTPLASMEIVDPVTRTVRTEQVAELAIARRAPSVIRLASGEVLVAGGFDASGDPVATLEWFAPDASQTTKRARDLVASASMAFMPLVGGGALAVIAPPQDAPTTFQSVWVIDADGALDAATPVAGSLTAPALFGGAGGAPVLWTGDRWLQWQPWLGSFGGLGVLDDAPARVGTATCSPDPGLAFWLDASGPALVGLRFDVQGVYSPLAGPLLTSDTSDMAPDRLPSPGVLSFDTTSGLAMGPGASAFVSDRTYADVTVDVDSPTGEPALVVLRDAMGNELEVGGTTCAGAITSGTSSLHVARQGASVAWAIAGGASGTCATGVDGAARLSIGLRAPASADRSLVRNLRVVRLGDPG